jgi:hypothetical protein
MEAKVKHGIRASVVICMGIVVAGLTASAAAQNTEWSNDTLNLRFAYPAEMVAHPAADAVQDGHLTLFGISTDADPELAAATHCLRPLLLLELPGADAAPTATATTPDVVDGSMSVTIKTAVAGTILLAELDVLCLTPEQQMKSKDLQTGMAEVGSKVPGMHRMMAPASYTVGSQFVHVAAAQGQPLVGPDAKTWGPLQIFTMGFSTNWNQHLLVWYFASNNTTMLNRMTKSTVKFGKAKPAPLYPVTIGNSTPGR